jgi:hypothetical protein
MKNESGLAATAARFNRACWVRASLVVAMYATMTFVLVGCAPQQLPFQVEGASGQVGHHMTADILLDEKAAGCGGHAGGSALVPAKALPPGIRQSGQNDWYFEGTPTQAGEWKTPVTLIDLVCDGPRPDQVISMEFNIVP